MRIYQASQQQLDVVESIVKSTIKAIYPHYYPGGAVSFFLSHHNKHSICRDIQDSCVFLAEISDTAVGTITIRKNGVSRFFVLPAFQKRGYGTYLMDFAEHRIFKEYDTAQIDASYPAWNLYFKRGYHVREYHKICAGDDYLCYHVMVKERDCWEDGTLELL